MTLDDDLDDLISAGDSVEYQRSERKHPSGWEPGVSWDGYGGTLTTQPLDSEPNDWADLLDVWDLDPTVFEVVEPVQYRAWDAPEPGGGVRRLYYYRATIRRKTDSRTSIEELLSILSKRKPKKAEVDVHGFSFCVPCGDLQLGKPDGDGTAGTVERFADKTEQAAKRLKDLRRLKRPISQVVLPWLGDCIEGIVSQGGAIAQAGRLDLTLTEQVRLYRRLILHQIQEFRNLSEKILVIAVPGNHDEVQRIGKVQRRYDDSWAIEGAAAVHDALKIADGFDHVSFVFPAKDELTVTLDVSGTPVGFAHGHQFGRDPMKWWAGQAHGMQAVGSSTLLLGAHFHHLRVEQSGAKTFIQIPALDGGSTWFRHKTGLEAPPGMVSLLVGDGSWRDLAVL